VHDGPGGAGRMMKDGPMGPMDDVKGGTTDSTQQ
jgi:hypothetical protein